MSQQARSAASVENDPSRHPRLVRYSVACGQLQTLIRTSTEWLGSV
jgi:hypothetical protein